MQNDRRPRVGSASGEAKVWYWLGAASILIIGALVRCYRVGDQIILDDEWHALNVVQNTGYAFIFSHLGHADHSIPLALLYEWFSHTIGLNEISMRLPSLIGGIAVIVVFPMLMRPWLGRGERLTTAALLAVSPFLINFSRVARPYSLLTLLTACSLPLAWRWWKGGRRGFGYAWYFCGVLAAWLNPASLAITLAPFLWFGAEAVIALLTAKDRRPLFRLAVIGAAMVVSIGALFYLPVEIDFISLTIKSGMDKTDPGTWHVLFSLFSGSGYDAVVVLMTLASLAGLMILKTRAARFTAYLTFVALASGFAVSMTGAQWINYGLVPARYLSGLLPVFLALIAIGLVSAADSLCRLLKLPETAAHGLVVLALLFLIIAGPLRSWDLQHSQFTGHLANQFDFKPSRNAIVQAHASLEVEPFYAEIAQLHPQGDAVIIEAPWYLESNFNPLYLSQRVHGQKVRIGFVGGLCKRHARGESKRARERPLYGELRPEAPGLDFRNFIQLTDLLAGRETADYLVLRRSGIEGARKIDMNFAVCEAAVRERFGPPWRSSQTALVFKLDQGV